MTNSLNLKEKNSAKNTTTMSDRKYRLISSVAMISSAIVMCPLMAFGGSVEQSLRDVQAKLVGTLLPLGAMCGLAIAGLSFVAGHPNARQHLFYAIVGAVVGFGAESIVSLIRSLIH
jgi:type IV secretory pathway VirB2 component (pilin)